MNRSNTNNTVSNTKFLSGTIRAIQDVMRKDAGVDGDAQRISQLTWILFLKLFDDYERERETSGRKYCSPIPENIRWRNWAESGTRLSNDELIKFVNDVLFPGLKNTVLTDDNPYSYIIHTVFQNLNNYMKSGFLLRKVIDQCNKIDFKSSKDRHLFGDIYEQVISGLQSAGNAGEFYTPRPVTQFIIDIIDPKLGERILDPACGTGGFLISAIAHICERNSMNAENEKVLQETILGRDKKPLPFLLCITNIILHGIGAPIGIKNVNSLSEPLASYNDSDNVDVIVTNPPFGGMEEEGIECNFPDDLRSRETTDLFLLLVMKLLKEHGRAAIILPDGALRGGNAKLRIRKKLLEEYNLHTIIRLPNGVFNPYTSIKTNLLFFTKGSSTQEIWYYEHTYPTGVRSYSKTKPIHIEEFIPIKEWWNKRQSNRHAWKVPIKEIIANEYNLDVNNPYRDIVNYGDPHKVVQEYREGLHEVTSIMDSLRNQLIWNQIKNLHVDKSIHLLFEYPGLLISIPDNLQVLRELILKLAMSGKLGTQDNMDGSASILLQNIEKKQKPFKQDGKITDSQIPPLFDVREIQPEMPDKWTTARLGQVGQIIGGGTPKTDHPKYFTDDGIPWITPADLYQFKDKFIYRGRRDISQLGLQNSSAKLLPAGTILFSSRAPIGYVVIAANQVTTSQGFKSYIPFLPEMSQYIYYFLKAYGKDIEKKAKGTTFKEISGREMANIIISLPPLEEQDRIVSKLDHLMSLCNDLEGKIQGLRHIGISVAGAIHQTVLGSN